MATTQVRATLSHNFLGAQGVYDNFLKANVDTTLHSPFGNQDVSGWFRENGREIPVHGLEYSHWEETRSNQPIYAAGAVGASAGATVTHTVDSTAGTMTYDSYSPFTASNSVTTSLPRAKSRILVGGVECIVLTVNTSANTYTCCPAKAVDTVPAVTAAEKIINLGVIGEEGDTPPTPIAVVPTEFTGQLTFQQDAVEFTDVAAMESVDIQMPDGSWVWTFKNWSQILQGFNNAVDATLFVGNEVTNPTALAAFPELVTGTGYIPYIETFGKTVTYTSGTMALSDIDELIKNAANNGNVKEYTAWGGIDAVLAFQELLANSSGSGANFSFKSFKKGQEMSVNLDFTTLHRAGMTFHLKSLDMFNHPELLGADGLDYVESLIFMPSVGTAASKNGGRSPHVAVRVMAKEGGGYQGGYEERFFSGINGGNDVTARKATYDVVSRKGIEAYGQLKHMMLKV